MSAMTLPKTIEARTYEEQARNTNVGSKLLEWAKEAVETERAFYDRFDGGEDDPMPPAWLAELEAAVKEAETKVP